MYLFKLSVLVTTYNHEKYIAQAIESILNQKIDFDYEIVVCDDCSKDNTREIIEKYRKEFPLKIRCLFNQKNLGVTKNLQQGFATCQGAYIAILEGDDYWISNNKLREQIDFLDINLDCSICFCGLLFFYEDKQSFEKFFPLSKPKYTTKDLIKYNFIGNFSTCMYRNDVVKKLPQSMYEIFTVDWMFNIACSEFGLLGCIPKAMTAYRKHSQGVWTSKKHEEQIREMIRLIPIYDEVLSFRYSENFAEAVRYCKFHLMYSKHPPNILKKFLTPFKKMIPSNAYNAMVKLFVSAKTLLK